MATLLITRDASGVPAWGLEFSSDAWNVQLSTGVEETITAPTSNTKGYLAVFSFEPGTSVWVSLESITLPTGTPARAYAQLNPGPKQIPAGATLYFKTANSTADIGVAFYELE